MTTIENTINGYKIIEYQFFNIYIIENVVDSSICEKYIKLIDESKLRNTEKDDNYSIVKCDFIDINRHDKTFADYDLELYKIFAYTFFLL